MRHLGLWNQGAQDHLSWGVECGVCGWAHSKGGPQDILQKGSIRGGKDSSVHVSGGWGPVPTLTDPEGLVGAHRGCVCCMDFPQGVWLDRGGPGVASQWPPVQSTGLLCLYKQRGGRLIASASSCTWELLPV